MTRKNINWILGISSILALVLAYFAIKYVTDAFTESAASMRTLRHNDGICLKQMRVVQIAIDAEANQREFNLSRPLCSAADKTLIRSRLVHMLGDTYELKCTVPGYSASEKSRKNLRGQRYLFWAMMRFSKNPLALF
jgi:hypothetical protein